MFALGSNVPPLLCDQSKGGWPGRDKCLHEVFQCRAEGDAQKGIMGVCLGTVNELVIVQVVRKLVAADTEVA